jgi:Asp-tRNA(Asn)/Glu-tRNA(Gln) amidotransferase A subunit family amidase
VSEVAYLEIAELAALIRRRMLLPAEATEAMLDRIAVRDGALQSYVQVRPQDIVTDTLDPAAFQPGATAPRVSQLWQAMRQSREGSTPSPFSTWA